MPTDVKSKSWILIPSNIKTSETWINQNLDRIVGQVRSPYLTRTRDGHHKETNLEQLTVYYTESEQ